jgi:glucose/arabinose dehydrogenase
MSPLRTCKIRLIGSMAAWLSLGLWPVGASAQSQSDNTSVADAARRAREQKKNAAKPVRTVTNDDLPPAPAAAAQPAAAASDQATPDAENGAAAKSPGPAESSASSDDAAKGKVEIEAALKRAKAELAQAQSELDVLQRKAALDSDAFYSQTDYARDADGKARLDANAQQVNDRKSRVEDLKAKIAVLQAQLGESAEPEKPAQPL